LLVDRSDFVGSAAALRRKPRPGPLLTSFALALSLAVVGLATTPSLGGASARGAAGDVLLGAWTVHFTPSSLNAFGRNIIRPAQLINGTVIQPGARFDFARIAGPFTQKNGYSSGAAIVRGRIQPDGIVGGGLCSAATTVFNAAVRAGLQIDKRFNHSFYISRYPVGLDATIWVNGTRGKNVVFTNDTGNPILIKGITTRKTVTFQVWGVRDGREVTFSDPTITNRRGAGTQTIYSDDVRPGKTKRFLDASDGFNAVVTRTVVSGGRTIHFDTFNSKYKPMVGIFFYGRRPGDPPAGTIKGTTSPPPPSPTPTPTRTPTPTPTGTPTPTPTDTPTPTPTDTPTPTPTPTETPPPTPTPSPTPTDTPPTLPPTDPPPAP
jgi:hypothetical protein